MMAWNEVKAKLYFRCLNIPRSGDAGYLTKLAEFVEKVNGLQYGLQLMDILTRKSVDVEQRTAFFCSELVMMFFFCFDC
jgi:hypothetical protein